MYASNNADDNTRTRFSETASPPHDVSDLFRLLRRNLRLICTSGVLGLAMGAAFVAVRPLSYTSTATLLLDSPAIRVLQDAYALMPGVHGGEGYMSSQIEFLRSEVILAGVVNGLSLDDGAIESKVVRSTLSAVVSMLATKIPTDAWAAPPSDPKPASAAREDVYRIVKNNLKLEPVPRTSILNVSYTSADPAFSARVANAIADAYVEDHPAAHRRAASRASDWISEQLRELKEQLQSSEAAVQKLRSERSLVFTDGRLVSDQRLSEVNKLLVAARGEVGRLSTRNNKLRTLLDGKLNDAVLAELSSDPIVAKLRSAYIGIASNLSSAIKQLGAGHQAVTRLQAQLAEYERLLHQELRRILSTFESELDIAAKNEARLAAEFDDLVKSSNDTNSSHMELQELERKSDSYRAAYKDYLQRYQAARQQQSFDERSARIINRAQPPRLDDSSAKGKATLMILLLAPVIGAVLGGGVGLVRELTDNTFRTRKQVRYNIGASTVWMLPGTTRPRKASRRLLGRKQELLERDPPKRDAIFIDALGRDVKTTKREPNLLHHVLDHGASDLARALSILKLDVDYMLRDHQRRIIAVTSAFPGEGRTTIAKNLASLLALSGEETLLIDCDAIGRALTLAIAPDAEEGVLEALAKGSEDSIGRFLHVEAASGLYFLPLILVDPAKYSADWLATSAGQRLLEKAGRQFKYVVLDLPAMNQRVETHAAAPYVDGIVYAVAWGQSPRAQITKMLDEEPEVRAKGLGVAVTFVDAERLKGYEGSGLLH